MASKRQDYIAKVRYHNDLPAPSLPPRLLKYSTRDAEKADSAELLSSLYTKTNVTNLAKVNTDMSMPIDLISLPGVLDQGNEEAMQAINYEKRARLAEKEYLSKHLSSAASPEEKRQIQEKARAVGESFKMNLHPDDKMLLRDPRADKLTKTDLANVTFLRRTEYVIATQNVNNVTKKRHLDDDESLTVEKQFQDVLDTFKSSELKHPTKKNVTAVKTFDFLPDSGTADQSFFTVRMLGSAMFDKKEKTSLDSAIFRPVELEQDTWMSMYVTNKRELSQKLYSTEDKVDGDENNYKFKLVRDYDMKLNKFETNHELVLTLDEEKGVCYYKPVGAKLELKKRRVNDIMRPIVLEHNIDQINFELREPTEEDQKERNEARHAFDPLEYPLE